MKIVRNQSGFTLLELLIAIPMTTLLVASVATMLFSYLSVRSNVVAASTVNHNLSVIDEKLSKIITGYTIGGVTEKAYDILEPSLGSAGSTLRLATQQSITSGDCGTANIICFSVVGDQLRIQRSSSSEYITSEDVSVTSFEATTLGTEGAKTVLVKVTVKYSGPEKSKYEKSLEFTYGIK